MNARPMIDYALDDRRKHDAREEHRRQLWRMAKFVGWPVVIAVVLIAIAHVGVVVPL